MQPLETAASFQLQVFPSQAWQQVSIVVSGKSREKGVIDLRDLRKRIADVLRDEKTGVHGPLRGVTYDVAVLKSVNNEGLHLEELDQFDLYGSFVRTEVSKRFLQALSNDDELTLVVDAKRFHDNRVMIMVAPRDMASFSYEMSRLTSTTMDYEIVIYSNTQAEQEAAQDYEAEILDYNAAQPAPLDLVIPVSAQQLEEPAKLVFLAKRGNDMLGFCACAILPYRDEISAAMEAGLDELTRTHENAEERYFMGVRPRNVFEIEGISVHPKERGKNTSLMLFYEALRFVRDPVMARLYPTTHVGSQAASYITKRYLTTIFDFRYHGSNHFMNETFIETLNDGTRDQLLWVLTETTAHIARLFGKNGRVATLKEWFAPRRKSPNIPLLLSMISDAIRLYQLYYLIIKSASRTGGITTTTTNPGSFSDPATAVHHFIGLFESIVSIVPGSREYAPLRKYLETNALHLQAYLKEPLLATLETEALYTIKDTRRQPMGPFKEYGFLEEARKPNSKRKIPYRQGYEIIYEALLTMAQLSVQLQSDTTPSLLIMDSINKLVLLDLLKTYDYEIPTDQLVAISLAIENILKAEILTEKTDDLKILRQLIMEKQTLMDKNVDFNSVFTNDLYMMPHNLSSGFDSYISSEKLAREWPSIEQRIMKRLAPKRQVVVVSEPSLPPPQYATLIPLPRERDQLFMDINVLYDILVLQPKAEAQFLFHGQSYDVATLKQHFIRLMQRREMADLILGSEKPEEGDDVESMLVEESSEVYRLEEFIDNESVLIMSEDEEDVLNAANI